MAFERTQVWFSPRPSAALFKGLLFWFISVYQLFNPVWCGFRSGAWANEAITKCIQAPAFLTWKNLWDQYPATKVIPSQPLPRGNGISPQYPRWLRRPCTWCRSPASPDHHTSSLYWKHQAGIYHLFMSSASEKDPNTSNLNISVRFSSSHLKSALCGFWPTATFSSDLSTESGIFSQHLSQWGQLTWPSYVKCLHTLVSIWFIQQCSKFKFCVSQGIH